jgi:hypothetical protein
LPCVICLIATEKITNSADCEKEKGEWDHANEAKYGYQ